MLAISHVTISGAKPPKIVTAGVTGTLADPRLEVYSAANTNTPLLTNDNWGTQTGGAAAVTAIQQAG